MYWQVSAPPFPDASAQGAETAALGQIEKLTKQLSRETRLRRQAEGALASMANGDFLAHVKGLERPLTALGAAQRERCPAGGAMAHGRSARLRRCR